MTSQPIYVTIPANFADTRIVQIGDDDVRVDILHERVRQAILPRDDKSLFLRMDATRDGAEHDGRDGPAEAGGRRQDRHHHATRRTTAVASHRECMREAVSDILIERARIADGMSRMLVRVAARARAFLAAIVLMPADWRSRPRARRRR